MSEITHSFEIRATVNEIVKVEGPRPRDAQHFAFCTVLRDGKIPAKMGIPIERGKYILGGDVLTVTVSWEHGDEQTRAIALATGELDPATEVDSEGNTPVPVGGEGDRPQSVDRGGADSPHLVLVRLGPLARGDY